MQTILPPVAPIGPFVRHKPEILPGDAGLLHCQVMRDPDADRVVFDIGPVRGDSTPGQYRRALA